MLMIVMESLKAFLKDLLKKKFLKFFSAHALIVNFVKLKKV